MKDNCNLFKRIYQWNAERDNFDFSLSREIRMLSEELFEMFSGYLDAKDEAKNFVKKYYVQINSKETSAIDNKEVRDQIADALGDLIYIAVGSLFKLGYDAECVLKTICDANDAKGKEKDEFGKIKKEKGVFKEPEINKCT